MHNFDETVALVNSKILEGTYPEDIPENQDIIPGECL